MGIRQFSNDVLLLKNGDSVMTDSGNKNGLQQKYPGKRHTVVNTIVKKEGRYLLTTKESRASGKRVRYIDNSKVAKFIPLGITKRID